jgi:hypothetical protein
MKMEPRFASRSKVPLGSIEMDVTADERVRWERKVGRSRATGGSPRLRSSPGWGAVVLSDRPRTARLGTRSKRRREDGAVLQIKGSESAPKSMPFSRR